MTYAPPSFMKKICHPADLCDRLAQLPGQKVFTNGCFDLLHIGHVTYLAQAAALGDHLIVAVNSDASVKRQGKGDDRPLNTLDRRMGCLAALESVAIVTWFEADTPLTSILDCAPDILVKGGDWPIDRIVGSAFVQSYGGQVHSIPFEHETSTTKLLEKIRHGASV